MASKITYNVKQGVEIKFNEFSLIAYKAGKCSILQIHRRFNRSAIIGFETSRLIESDYLKISRSRLGKCLPCPEFIVVSRIFLDS